MTKYLEKILNGFELGIAIFLLVVIAIELVVIIFGLFDVPLYFFTMEFKQILSRALALVIGVEFAKMLCKHTPETVVDVLLFAISRQIVMYHDSTFDLLVGIIAISGLFAIKKYLTIKLLPKNEEASLKEAA